MRRLLKTLGKKEKMVVSNNFSLFPQCFLPFSEEISLFDSHLFCRLLSVWSSQKFHCLIKIEGNTLHPSFASVWLIFTKEL